MTAPPPGSGRRSASLRRYPALAWLLGAGVLALLLPSALTVPQSGPPTLAEYSPVPGQGEGRADVSELGQPSSGGLGSGGGQGGAGGERAAATTTSAVAPGRRTAGGGVRRPGTKRCVGDPPRQTEDPLSPPCVAFWEGDNGGATAKGVTGDEVRIVAQLEKTTTDPRAGEVVDCLAGHDPENDTFQDTLCKAYQRYFNERYQTYGRVVHLWSSHDVRAAALDESHDPFAYVSNTASSGFSTLGILAVGYLGNERTSYQKHAPLMITFRPDVDDLNEMAASYLCQKLVGRHARYSGNVLDRDRTRVFGFLTDTTNEKRRDAIRAAVRERCDHDIAIQGGDLSGGTGVARLQSEQVTTVIVMGGNASVAAATHHAARNGWFPEWFVPGTTDQRNMDVNFYGRLANQAEWANAFGLSVDTRRGPLQEQPWYRAYREGCPDCPVPQLGQQGVSTAAAIYDALQLAFYGIQAAGPRLTHDNIDRGLHAIAPQASDDPFRPAAYFAPGNYSFVKDAMAIWWDATGTPPGSTSQGCYRLVEDGRRRRAGEWPAGDEDVKRMGPCQGDTFQ